MTINDLELYCLCERECFGGFLEKEAPSDIFRIQRGIEEEDSLRVEGGGVLDGGGEVRCSTHEPVRQRNATVSIIVILIRNPPTVR